MNVRDTLWEIQRIRENAFPDEAPDLIERRVFDAALAGIQDNGADPALFQQALASATKGRNLGQLFSLTRQKSLSLEQRRRCLDTAFLAATEENWPTPWSGKHRTLAALADTIPSEEDGYDDFKEKFTKAFEAVYRHPERGKFFPVLDDIINFRHHNPPEPRKPMRRSDSGQSHDYTELSIRGIYDRPVREPSFQSWQSHRIYQNALSKWREQCNRPLSPQNPILLRARSLAQERAQQFELEKEAARQREIDTRPDRYHNAQEILRKPLYEMAEARFPSSLETDVFGRSPNGLRAITEMRAQMDLLLLREAVPADQRDRRAEFHAAEGLKKILPKVCSPEMSKNHKMGDYYVLENLGRLHTAIREAREYDNQLNEERKAAYAREAAAAVEKKPVVAAPSSPQVVATPVSAPRIRPAQDVYVAGYSHDPDHYTDALSAFDGDDFKIATVLTDTTLGCRNIVLVVDGVKNTEEAATALGLRPETLAGNLFENRKTGQTAIRLSRNAFESAASVKEALAQNVKPAAQPPASTRRVAHDNNF